MGFGSAGLAGTRLPRGIFRWRAIPAPILKEAASFFGWTVIALGLAASTERLDLFLLGRLSGPVQAGLYGGVLTLAIIPDFFGGMLATVLQPRVVNLRQEGRLGAFSQKLMLAMLPCCLLAFLILYYTANLLVPSVLGSSFTPVVPAFMILAAASLGWLVLTPVAAILISLTAPRTTIVLTMVQFAILGTGGALMIPQYGAIGAASAVAGTRLCMALVIIVIGRRMMRRAVVGIPSTG
jgi:O-antigen/teichoic acid export membrane protein